MPSSEFVALCPDRFRRPAQPVQERLPAFLLQADVDRPRREPLEVACDRVQLLYGRSDRVQMIRHYDQGVEPRLHLIAAGTQTFEYRVDAADFGPYFASRGE